MQAFLTIWIVMFARRLCERMAKRWAAQAMDREGGVFMAPKRKFHASDDPFYNLDQAVSATEATGLMPAAPRNEDQAEASAALYAVHKPKGKRKEKR
jgi:hypothetical protein